MKSIATIGPLTVFMLGLAACGGGSDPGPFVASAEQCAALAGAGDWTDATTTWVPAAGTLPQYCRLEAAVRTGDATEGVNKVRFQLKLPSTWNEKFYMAGGGGFAGGFSNTDSALAAGYATVSTDTGHTGSSLDAKWALNNMPALIDFGYRGVNVSTVAGKHATVAYYKRPIRRAYFEGCSSGGRQALMQIQRYPTSYDGIIAGHPAIKTGTAGVYIHTWVQQALLANPLPVEVAVLSKGVNAACDALDGIVDGILDDPRQCRFDPATLQCPGNVDGPNCLTTGQIKTVNAIYGGPRSNGMPLMRGILPGAEAVGPAAWDYWYLRGLPSAGLAPIGSIFQDQELKYFYFNNPNYDWRTFNFDTDAEKIRFLDPILHATQTDLSVFRSTGGKAIMYQGYNDPTVPALETIDYYEGVVSRIGTASETESFLRLFMMPGVQHCGSTGSPGPNTLSALRALEDWVEKGVPPDRIIATHRTAGVVDMERPLCPYPRVARRIDPHGSTTAASNFACVMP
jgi:feruloyl esterase